jgi:hypothetical protein
MEVHAHTHTPRKKWTHYFWEFFMLFLAVFCGFLAENQREHFVEHNREKQFMRSLTEDLETDTLELHSAIDKAEIVSRNADSVLIFLASYKISKEIPLRLASLVGLAGMRQVLINTDRTSSQLKNSGAMRLIRSKKVSDLILKYWKQIEETNISLDRYMLYRNASRELAFKLWVIPNVYQSGLLMNQDSIHQLRVIDLDSKKWDEFANLTAMCGEITRTTHLKNVKQQLELARELIMLIKKEYHFK